MFVQNVYHLLYKHTLSGGDPIAVLHTHDGMVWHHPVYIVYITLAISV